MIKNKALKRRIIEISYKNKLSHLGSCLTAVDIIDEIYSIKKPDEKFVLSSGHAGLALYCVLEKYNFISPPDGAMYLFIEKTPKTMNAEEIFKHHGVHPDKCAQCGIDCSSGSLGNGLPIAVGMALAEKQKFDSQMQDSCPTIECEHQRMKNVYCLISDGECSEGSIFEATRILVEQKLSNLKLCINWNKWGAYKKIDNIYFGAYMNFPMIPKHDTLPLSIYETNVDDFPFLKDQEAHYKVMDEKDYKQAMEILK